jgi:hypothetical protein
MDKQKIAVCFYGQMRLFELLNDFFSTWNSKSDKYHYDFFISSWDDFDTSRISLPLVSSNYENEDVVTKTWDEGHTKKMAYHFSKVNKLKQEYEISKEFGYDKVLTLRPDIMLDFKQLERNLDEFNTVEHSVGVLDRLREVDGYSTLDGDYLFVSTTEASNIHANIYSYFYLTEKYRKVNRKYKEGGHWIHPFYLTEVLIKIQSLQIPTIIIRPTRDLETLQTCISDKDAINTLANAAKEWTLEDDLIVKGSAVREYKGRLL